MARSWAVPVAAIGAEMERTYCSAGESCGQGYRELTVRDIERTVGEGA